MTEENDLQKLTKKLNNIQQKLKAPKGQKNTFGKYNFRSCEDILEAVKPLLNDCVIIFDDEIVVVGDRYYVKTTAMLTDGSKIIETVAYAREPLSKKGFDESQITGASSSYARKYALNSLLLIDDNKDSDSTNHGHQRPAPPRQAPIKPAPPKSILQQVSDEINQISKGIEAARKALWIQLGVNSKEDVEKADEQTMIEWLEYLKGLKKEQK